MAELERTMLSKLQTHYSSPNESLEDLMRRWETDNSIAGSEGSMRTFLLAAGATGSTINDLLASYFGSIYV